MSENNIEIKVTAGDVSPAEVAAEIEKVVKRRQPRQPRQPKPDIAPVDPVLADVIEELSAQDEKWGVQDHPLIGGWTERERVLRRNYAARAAELKQLNDGRVAAGTMGWDTILLEEAYEALEEADFDKAAAELIQVAAVAINAVRSIRRQKAAEVAA